MVKTTIIGLGQVGVSLLGCLMHLGGSEEIVVIDKDEKRAEGEVMDFQQSGAMEYAKNPRLRTGKAPDMKGSDFVVITAGVSFSPGQTRDEIAAKNAKLIKMLIKDVETHAPECVVIMVTNPVETMTTVALDNSSFPRERLFSAGTLLDTMRLRTFLGREVGLDPRKVHANIMGDHGDTSFCPWSMSNIAGMPIDTYTELNKLPKVDKEALVKETRNAAYQIFDRKGYTSHGVGAAVYRLIRAMKANEQTILPVGVRLKGEYGINDDTVMCIPCVLGMRGIQRVLQVPFTPDEQQAWEASLKHQRENIKRALEGL